MSGARKIAVWDGMTQTHRFTVDVFEDDEQGLFIANIEASNPPLASALRLPGQKPAMIEDAEPEKLTYDDLEILKAKTQQTLTKRFGKILQFRERQA